MVQTQQSIGRIWTTAVIDQRMDHAQREDSRESPASYFVGWDWLVLGTSAECQASESDWKPNTTQTFEFQKAVPLKSSSLQQTEILFNRWGEPPSTNADFHTRVSVLYRLWVISHVLLMYLILSLLKMCSSSLTIQSSALCVNQRKNQEPAEHVNIK